ncbi:type II toxin-antitoxin system VapC family toxin [Mycobacterium sp.]|uniref:type II toxin-antitoxin system VapC family toxin n=1 Tax=Mycobacterium sp. TaxID=1785 RepID=UPI0025DD9B66|nr:type II toxin-antitoxin system VapC family toxin [Mycobacterium sp.]
MLYLDPTAIMKLIIPAPESPALHHYLQARTDIRWFTCALSRADVLRQTAPHGPAATDRARHVLAGLDLVAVTDRLLDAAISLTPAPDRTADALHVAAARSAGPRLHTLITYDPMLATAANDNHIQITKPGGAP